MRMTTMDGRLFKNVGELSEDGPSWFTSHGRLAFSILDNGLSKLIIEADQGIVDYYFSMIPKYVRNLNRPRYRAHISVIRNERVTNQQALQKLSREINRSAISFEYCNTIYHTDLYYWLDIRCPALREIRKSVGLPELKHGVTFSPDERHQFHMTIGNTKGNIAQKERNSK